MSHWIAAGRAVISLVATLNAPAASIASDQAEGSREAGDADWIPPKPPGESEIFQRWLGTWICEGTAEGPQGTKTKYNVTWKWTSVLGSQWYSAVYTRPRQGKVVALEANITVGYDRAEKKYLFTSFDGFGGWTRLSSVDGASYAGEGTPSGAKGPVRITFTRGKDERGRATDGRIEVKLEVGGPPITESCRK